MDAKVPRTHYEALGITSRATADEIKAAFRKRVMETHPDHSEGNREQFEAVHTAYKVLSDRDRRAHYDASGEIPDRVINGLDHEAMGLIGEAIGAIINDKSINPTFTDVMAEMRSRVQEGIDGAQNALRELDELRTRVTKFRDGFERKSDKSGLGGMENLLRATADAKLREIDRKAKGPLEHIDKLRRVLEILADYEFKRDPSTYLANYLPPPLAMTLNFRR